MKRVSDQALLATLTPAQIHEVHSHILNRISDARRQWHDLGNLADPELDTEILKVFKQLDELENNLETVEQYIKTIARHVGKRAA